MSNGLILFARQDNNHGKVLLRDESASTTTLLAADDRTNVLFTPGQVSGNWVTWARYNFARHRGNVHRYNVASQSAQSLPRPKNRAQYASSIAPDGTLFYVRAKLGCGRHVVIRENVPHGSDVPLYQLPANHDISKTYTVSEGGGVYSVYFDESSCSTRKSNIYKLTVS